MGVRRAASPRAARRSSTRPTTSQEAERYADRVLVLADGELLFAGTPAALAATVERRRGGGPRDFEAAFVALPPRARALSAMRWLLLKDLQILRRSPLLVGAAGALPDR